MDNMPGRVGHYAEDALEELKEGGDKDKALVYAVLEVANALWDINFAMKE